MGGYYDNDIPVFCNPKQKGLARMENDLISLVISETFYFSVFPQIKFH
jgi:hypothetical protein